MYGIRTLTKSARWLRSRFHRPRALILAYHRVADESGWDPYALSVTPQFFAEQLEAVRKHATPISLQALTQSLQRDDLPPRSVAITLDDGYVDNLHHAKPLLMRYECPATVFVATGYIGRKFWWDELAEMLRPTLPLPEQIRLSVGGRTFERTLTHSDNARRRRDLVLALYNFMCQVSGKERTTAIAQLWDVVGRNSAPKSLTRAMTQRELCELTADGSVDIGAHTVTHPFLSTLPKTLQQEEIAMSKSELERLLERRITSFSFPNGSSSRVTTKAVREAGFLRACGIYADVVWRRSDVFYLPRLWTPNCGGRTFTRWLRHWMGS